MNSSALPQWSHSLSLSWTGSFLLLGEIRKYFFFWRLRQGIGLIGIEMRGDWTGIRGTLLEEALATSLQPIIRKLMFLIFQKPQATMPFLPGYEEDRFLQSLEMKAEDIEPKASNCTKVRPAGQLSFTANYSNNKYTPGFSI